VRFSRREFLGLAGALGVGWIAWGADERAGRKGFSVAAVNDIHVLDAASTALLDRAVERINALPDVRFTVVLDDISTDGKREQFDLAKRSLDRLARPYVAVPGNHDVPGKGALAYREYTRDFNERSWVRQEDDWYFIGLDSCEGGAADVNIPLGQVAWLHEQLEKIPADRPIALFAHYPFNPHTLRIPGTECRQGADALFGPPPEARTVRPLAWKSGREARRYPFHHHGLLLNDTRQP